MFATRTLTFTFTLFLAAFVLFSTSDPGTKNPFNPTFGAALAPPVGELGPGMEPEG